MIWPKELAAIIIAALQLTSDQAKGLTVIFVLFGYVISLTLIALAISKLPFFEIKK